VTVKRDFRILLTTDKPLYQPGQIIHIRALALGNFDLKPAVAQSLEFTVSDGKGNTVFRKTLSTSEFGVAAVDFQLADEVNTGPYKLTAALGDTTSEKTVTVEHYVLPKFKVTLTTDRTFYRPGDHVEGSLKAAYFFGKDVTEGKIKLEGYTYDFQRNVAVTLEGTTNATGAFVFSFDLPAYIAGSELEGGGARFYLEAAVTDQAEHVEVGRLSLPVAQQALVINAVLEGGTPRPNVENILYVLASYPDGTPAETALTVALGETGEMLTGQTGKYGLAEVRFTPSQAALYVSAHVRDATGASASRNFYFEGQWDEETVLLRPDAPLYRVGDTMQLAILTSAQRGTVYLDITRAGQTVSTRAVDVTDGKADVAVDVTPDLYGTLELHAYKILRSGNTTRDTRLVIVEQANDLNVTLTPGAESYKPGEDATLDVQVNGADGAGVTSALGLAVVDESVFALAEQDPGFAKLYFMLEAELLQPKYELHGFNIPDMIAEPEPISDPVLREAQAEAGKAALASAVSADSPFSLAANSHQWAMQRAEERQAAFFTGLAKGLYGLVVFIPLAVMALSGIAVWRQRGAEALAAAVRQRGDGVWRAHCARFDAGRVNLVCGRTFLARERRPDGAAGRDVWPVGLVGVIGSLVIAITRKDGWLGAMLGLVPVWFGLLVFLIFAAERGDFEPGDWAVAAGLIALFLLPLAFMLRSASFALEKRPFPVVAALGTALILVVLPLLTLAGGMSQRAFSNTVADLAARW
jgi:hypothetical protein